MTDVNPEETARPTTPAPAERRSNKRRNRLRTALAVVLALLVLLLLTLTAFIVRLSVPVGAPKKGDITSGMEWVRSIYGWGKGENQQLYGPTDVAIGPDGTIWVNDPQRWQLVAFNPDGSFKTIVHQGPGYMMPQAFDVSANNEIYIADFKNLKIRVFSPNNKELRSWNTSLPTEVSVKGDRVFVGQGSGMAVYDTKGALIAKWGSRGKGVGQVDIVRGTAIGPDGSLYISDTENHRVKSYTADGKLKWVYPTNEQFNKWADESAKGIKPKKPFQIPAGMTFDSAGRLVLVDAFEFKVMILDPANGHVKATYGDYGATDGKFAYPTSISFDPARDWFAVADTANNRVQIIRITGSGGSPLSGLARASAGPVWVCAIPLILLLIAIAIAVIRRRNRDDEADETQASDGDEEQE